MMDGMPGMGSANISTSRDDAKIKDLEMISTRAGNGKMNEKEMRDVANQFENMIFRMLMKEMRKTVPENKLMGNDHSMKMYQEIADDYMVEELTEGNDLGIESVIYNELYEANKNIVDPSELEQQEPGFVPLKKDMMNNLSEENEAEFVPLPMPHTEMIDIHTPQQWVDLPTEQNGFVPILQRHHIPTSKIDDSI